MNELQTDETSERLTNVEQLKIERYPLFVFHNDDISLADLATATSTLCDCGKNRTTRLAWHVTPWEEKWRFVFKRSLFPMVRVQMLGYGNCHGLRALEIQWCRYQFISSFSLISLFVFFTAYINFNENNRRSSCDGSLSKC